MPQPIKAARIDLVFNFQLENSLKSRANPTYSWCCLIKIEKERFWAHGQWFSLLETAFTVISTRIIRWLYLNDVEKCFKAYTHSLTSVKNSMFIYDIVIYLFHDPHNRSLFIYKLWRIRLLDHIGKITDQITTIITTITPTTTENINLNNNDPNECRIMRATSDERFAPIQTDHNYL